jgi:uncharacterized DUF497 family protein
MFFAWNDQNDDRIAKHRVERFEAEQVVRSARRPYPRRVGHQKYMVKGSTAAGRWLQVIYVRRVAEAIRMEDVDIADRAALSAGEPAVYVIHPRDLRPRER